MKGFSGLRALSSLFSSCHVEHECVLVSCAVVWGVYFCDMWSYSAADLGLFLLSVNTCRSFSMRFGAGTAPRCPTLLQGADSWVPPAPGLVNKAMMTSSMGPLPRLHGTFSGIATGMGGQVRLVNFLWFYQIFLSIGH